MSSKKIIIKSRNMGKTAARALEINEDPRSTMERMACHSGNHEWKRIVVMGNVIYCERDGCEEIRDVKGLQDMATLKMIRRAVNTTKESEKANLLVEKARSKEILF